MPSYETLINQQLSDSTSGLIIVDENLDASLLRPAGGWQALTNRFDQYTQLSSKGWECSFSDFAWPIQIDIQHLVYRVSKERAVVHHLLNLMAEHLRSGARVTLFGDKSEGIKTYAKNAQKLLGGDRQEKKLGGESWVVELTVGTLASTRLDDQHYTKLRSVAEVSEHSLLSKPGVYGWKKIDKGSEQLTSRLSTMLNTQLPLGSLELLDLGCGSGYLALAAAGPETAITATDNNAGAKIATLGTLQNAGFKARFEYSNAGEELNHQFDLILCNPPFHSGFGVDYDLTARFSRNAARLLKHEGRACFVVNQHVPLKRIASNYFDSVELDLDSGSFCTYLLTKPRT